MIPVKDLAQIKEFPEETEVIKGQRTTLKTAEMFVEGRHFADEIFRYEDRAIYGRYISNVFYLGNLFNGQKVRTVKLPVEVKFDRNIRDEEKGKEVLRNLDARIPNAGDIFPVYWCSAEELPGHFKGERYVNIAPDPALDIGVALGIEQIFFRKPGQDCSEYKSRF